MMRHARWISGLAAVVVAGCAGSEPVEDPRYAEVANVARLPYRVDVRVNVDEASSTELPAVDELREGVTRALTDGLRNANAFVESGPNLPQPDVVLEASVRPRSELERDRQLGLSLVSVLLWIGTGVFHWIVPDQRFQSEYTVVLSMRREEVDAPSERRSETLLEPEEVDLNLFERSSWPQALMQILVPPPLVPRNELRTRRVLRDVSFAELGTSAAVFAKTAFPIDEVAAVRPFVYFDDGADGNATVFVYSRDQLDLAFWKGDQIPVVTDIEATPAPGSSELRQVFRQEAEDAKQKLAESLRPLVDGGSLDTSAYFRVYRFALPPPPPGVARAATNLRLEVRGSPTPYTFTLPGDSDAPLSD